jgi:uncharacterized short protein YbdD (DUF466 family)
MQSDEKRQANLEMIAKKMGYPSYKDYVKHYRTWIPNKKLEKK